MPDQRRPFDEIHRRLLRAARNGERLHLEPEHVRAIMRSPLYMALAELVQDEIVRGWTTDAPAVADPGVMVEDASATGPECDAGLGTALADVESEQALLAAAGVISAAACRRRYREET